MRCPKCHYLSFDPEPRCRNCGYGFSLDDADLPLRAPESSNQPMPDLSIRSVVSDDADVMSTSRRVASRRRTAADSAGDTSPVAPSVAVAEAPMEAAPPAENDVRMRPAPTTELPLFVKALSAAEPTLAPEPSPVMADDTLLRTPVEPRAPLAVRKKAPDSGAAARARAAAAASRKLGPLDRDLLEDLQRIEKVERKEALTEARAEARAAAERALPADRAGASKRLAAAALDAVLMGGLASVLLWVVLRWCDLPVERMSVLPAAPIAAFLLLVGLGYLLMFTAAGGQTLGKMAFHIRVVGADDPSGAWQAITVRQAVYRALLTVPSVLALGVGFVPALIGDERAIHDRLAHTRVVRA